MRTQSDAAALERGVREASRELLASRGFQTTRLTLLRQNTGYVYRVDCAAGRFTLRVRPAEAMAPKAAEALRRWLSALARETELTVPVPVRIGNSHVARMNGNTLAMFEWVEGKRAGSAEDFVKPDRLAATGRATAMLHRHAEKFAAADGAIVPRWNAAKFLSNDSCVGAAGKARLGPAAVAAFRPAAPRLRLALRELGESPQHFGFIHRDLEPPNWLFHRGEARPVDFDAFGVGHYLFDLAQVLWTHAMWPGHDRYFKQLIDSYETERPLTRVERKHLRVMQALPMLDWINRWMMRDDREGRAAMKRWLTPTIKRMRELCDVS
jgi:Ser/Thr protein kinase RdoA (MazF antagonist)